MFKPVQFAPEVESLVLFVEETPEDRIIPATIEKLRSGTAAKALLTGAALAVTRSTELPAIHHGGPIHPICGIHPVYQTAQRLTGEWAYVPIVHNVALANKHVHATDMGPYIMPEMQPLEGKPGGVQGTKDAFQTMVQRRYPTSVEGYLLWLLPRLSHGEIMDVILTAAIPKNPNDDHQFLYPSFSFRALDALGWEWAPVLLRPPARYQARNPFISSLGPAPDYKPIEGLLDKHKLLELTIPLYSTSSETKTIGSLGERIGACDNYAEIPELLAQAIVGGLSLEGAGEALSIAAGLLFLRSKTGNPMDVHLHTGINVRRYLLKQEGISIRNKLLALFTWYTGPEVRSNQGRMEGSIRMDPKEIDALPGRSQQQLLDDITQSIYSQPPVDWSVIGRRLDMMIAAPQVKETVALAHQYVHLKYDPMALFRRLGEIACRDDFTEMHVFKMHQASVEEYYSTREPYRWVHLVSAVKAAAIIDGKKQDTYKRIKELVRV